MQARKAVGDEPFAPPTDGVTVAPKVVGNVLVGRVVRLSRAQDDTAAENQGLGGGAGTDQRFQFGPKVVLQFND